MMINISEAAALRFLQEAQERRISVEGLLEQLSLTLSDPLPNSPEQVTNDDNRRAGAGAGSGLGSVRSSPWVEKAVEKALELPPGAEFSLGTLLRDHWGELPEQRVLGKMFRRRVEEAGIAIREGDWEEGGMARMAKYKRL